MVPLDIIYGPRLKVQRAHRHINELRAHSEPLSKDLYTITVESSAPSADQRHRIRYVPINPIPEIFALIIGDVVHNLRAALDHLATGIIRSVDPNAKPFFPIAPKRESLVAASALTAIEKAIPGAKDMFLNKIRPENGSDEALWRFNDLDNDDKHNLILPVITVTRVSGTFTSGPLVASPAASFGNNAAHPFVILESAYPITIKDEFNATVDIKFGEGTPFKNDPVVPTLTQIAGLVTKTIDQFESLIHKSI